MTDREKVINCLKDIEQIMVCRQEICPREELQYWIELQEGVADALALLKEQEAVEPRTEHSAKGYLYTCGACGWWLFEVRDTVHCDDRKRIRFCASCGQAVKWE